MQMRRRVVLVLGLASLLVGLVAPPGSAGGGGPTTRVSVSSTGAQGNGASFGFAISADGRYVALRT